MSEWNSGGSVAYFITFRSYGTWLPGDSRNSVDRRRNIYGTISDAPDAFRRWTSEKRMSTDAVTLDARARAVVENTIREVCQHNLWELHATAVRSNHVHVVVSAPGKKPEQVMNTMKSWSTRALREKSVLARGIKPWARHGSTQYIWRENDIVSACQYVAEGQDGPWKPQSASEPRA